MTNMRSIESKGNIRPEFYIRAHVVEFELANLIS